MSIFRLLPVGERLASKIPVSGDHRDFLKKNEIPSELMFKSVTAREVEIEILALPNNKSHGLYSCPSKLLKYSNTIISDILAKIVNLSATSGSYPSKLKKTKVIPVLKLRMRQMQITIDRFLSYLYLKKVMLYLGKGYV